LHAADSMLLSHVYIIAHPEVSFSDGLYSDIQWVTSATIWLEIAQLNLCSVRISGSVLLRFY
jgi:hypothetical protein